ncbi:TerC family protein [Paenibacillus dokdonensis]|uniref:TerC family protein n=1 Tax=Paenibacillus dokdonensis TaxID=2567944 RepID=A0ABU6GMA5_9BACL|nr:TerC family protein [Paenibacillus dokdonensis]MEC0239845.1 TerC family protein [Paenibacillus dokdonensis]
MDIEWLLLGLLKIIVINIVLSGDNAVVIALACKSLPPEQQKKAVFYGSFGAIVLRFVLTIAAIWLLRIPFVELAGGLLLLWIALKLMQGEEQEENLEASPHLGRAIRTIIIADLVMSLDNVVAIAGAASGNYILIALGLAISIPLIIWGSKLLMALMNRFPVIILLGVALLGYTAGEMVLSDSQLNIWVDSLPPFMDILIPLLLAAAVVIAGNLLKRSRQLHGKQGDRTATGTRR